MNKELPVYEYVRDYKVPFGDNAPIAHDDPITCMAIQEFLDRVNRPGGCFGEITSPDLSYLPSAEAVLQRLYEIRDTKIAIRIIYGQYTQEGVLILKWQPFELYRNEPYLFENCTLAPRTLIEPSAIPGSVAISRFITCDLGSIVDASS